MMQRVIKAKKENNTTLARIEALMELAPIPDVVDELELRQKDLVLFMGSKRKVSEVLAGKRSLSLCLIRRLHERLRNPVEILLGQEAVAWGKGAEDSPKYLSQREYR